MTLRDAARRPLVANALAKGQVQAPAGKPVNLSLEGAIDETPVTIRVGIQPYADDGLLKGTERERYRQLCEEIAGNARAYTMLISCKGTEEADAKK